MTVHEPWTVLDDNGLCNHCHRHAPFVYNGEEWVLDTLKGSRRKDSEYDCAVALSGGRDSTYTLLKLVRDWDLKVLAINYDNPFTHPLARANIRNAVAALDVDLVSFRLRNHIHERTFRSNLRSWCKVPDPSMIPMLCVGCKNMMYHIIRIARSRGVPAIVNGGNMFEDSTFKKELLGLDPDTSIRDTYSKALTGVARGLMRNPSYLRPWYLPTMVKGYLFGDPYTPGSRWYGRNIVRLDLFHHVPWNERECLTRIRSELGWTHPRGLGTWRWDCMVGSLKEAMYSSSAGVMEKEDFYSKQIREGMISRNEALERLRDGAVDPEAVRSNIERLMEIAEVQDRSMVTRLLNDPRAVAH